MIGRFVSLWNWLARDKNTGERLFTASLIIFFVGVTYSLLFWIVMGIVVFVISLIVSRNFNDKVINFFVETVITGAIIGILGRNFEVEFSVAFFLAVLMLIILAAGQAGSFVSIFRKEEFEKG